jgi:prepilin-type N-terminal cleavage/methylation domain-containing protein
MFRKVFASEEGFTLVELLVTIAILAVLFGIVTLTLAGVGDNAEDTVCAAELAVVQSAVDIYLAADGDVSEETTATTVDSSTPEFGKYLRTESQGTYTWTDTGVVTQVVCPPTP